MILRGPHQPDLRREECLADILTATARRCPEAAALVWGERTVRYRELDASSDAIGAALGRRGAAAGEVVGLLLPRGADLLIAQAGITKSGAAWLPLDADTPLERVQTCLQAANVVGLVACREWLPRLQELSAPVWAVEDLLAEKPSAERDAAEPYCVRSRGDSSGPSNNGNGHLASDHPSNDGAADSGAVRISQPAAIPSDAAYVIYTSGSTGQPKGIAISQRSICHFLRSENEVLGVRQGDVVYQGFSVAFDMSFEEIWISYLVGATLWIAPPSLVGDPDSLAQTIARERITVLHAVPTLMGLLDDPLPTVRLINLGGEACPDSLAARLARPGRRIFNTYGPTETSVSATIAELKSDEAVTIGRPLPNYGVLVVNEQRQPVPAGEVGELCIFGPGLALGYLGQPELTAQRFVANPLATNVDEELMYLTGDLARIEPGGPVHCFGRLDGQVKIRGFRVELDEITSWLSVHPGVAAAATVVRLVGETDQVVGFVLPVANHTIDPSELRQLLAQGLPSYMIPAHFEIVAELPRLTSGKIDHRALRDHPLTYVAPTGEADTPQNEDQVALFAALGRLFPGQSLRLGHDFFDDLGGHSLLAARLVSILRGDARYAALGVQEIYRRRRLGEIALVMQRLRGQKQPAAAPPRSEISRWRHFLCGAAQAAVIPFFVSLHMADWLSPFFVYHYYTGDDDDSVSLAVLYSLLTFVLAQFVMFFIAIVGKRLVAWRLPAGRYPLWGWTYFRWWLANKFCELPDVFLLSTTPFMGLYLRALGARVGRDVFIDTLTLGAAEMLTIDDGVSLGAFVNVENARVAGGELIIGPVHVKREAVVDSSVVLENDTVVGEGSRLRGLSALSAGRQIADGEIWEGAPARLAAVQHSDPLPPRPQISFVRRWAQAVAFVVTAFAVSVLFFLPTFPAFMLIDWFDARTLDYFDSKLSPLVGFGFFLLLAIPASALFVSLTMLVTGLLRRLSPAQAPGMFSLHSLAFWRKNLMSLILDCSLRVLHGLYASVFAPTWLRFLGAKVGSHAEISTAEGMSPELLNLGDDSFIADGALLGDEDLRGGWMVLKPTRVGNRSFIGNGAYIPDGAVVPDDLLIGVQTSSPTNDQLRSGQTWMGSPPILLPARERLKGFPESLTFRPSPLRRCARGLIESLRIVLPLAAAIATGYLIVIEIVPLAAEYGWGPRVALALAVAGCLYGVVSFLTVVALKWILIGHYRPRAAPMWTWFVWTSEAVTNLYESLAVPNLLDVLRGTPMLPWALWLLGAKIGRRVYLNTTDLTEFDCVAIGDEAELNAWCGPQTHLFEDRVMKIGEVAIGARVTVGTRCTILYDTQIGDEVILGPLTLVAKGERLPPGTCWEGSPAAPVQET